MFVFVVVVFVVGLCCCCFCFCLFLCCCWGGGGGGGLHFDFFIIFFYQRPEVFFDLGYGSTYFRTYAYIDMLASGRFVIIENSMRPKERLCRINKELAAIFVSDFLNKELIRVIQHCIHTAALTAYLPQAQDNVHGTLTPVTRVRQLSIVTTQRRLLHTVDRPLPETGQTPSTALRHPFFPPWRRVPESDARSVETGVLQLGVWKLECYSSECGNWSVTARSVETGVLQVREAGKSRGAFSGFLRQKNRWRFVAAAVVVAVLLLFFLLMS